jgi:hypothetical protein
MWSAAAIQIAEHERKKTTRKTQRRKAFAISFLKGRNGYPILTERMGTAPDLDYSGRSSFFSFFSRRSSFLLSSRVESDSLVLKGRLPSRPFITLPFPSIPFGRAISSPCSVKTCLMQKAETWDQFINVLEVISPDNVSQYLRDEVIPAFGAVR